jgi:hypothetical protein
MLGAQGRPDGFCWWIDSVGGFRTFSRDRIQIGNIANKRNQVAVMGDLSAQHAELLREQQGWVLIAHAETQVNGKSGTSFSLKDGDKIAMRAVQWAFHQPMSWSKTARLELLSRHRLPMGLDGVVLLSETCALGNRRDAHIPAPWETPVVVTWQRGSYWLRGPGDLWIDDKKYGGWGPLSPASEVRGDWGSFRWEPIAVGSESSIGGK